MGSMRQRSIRLPTSTSIEPRGGRPRATVNWARRSSGLLLGAALFTSADYARAGNLDSYYLGVDATLQAGAITADTRGGGSTWYNPAGLAQSRESALDASIGAYSLRVGGHPDFEATGDDTQVTRLTSTDLKVVPAALSFVRRVGQLGIGLGVFVPSVQSLQLRTLVKTAPHDNDTNTPRFGADVFGRSQDYHAGLAVGAQITPRVRVGASLFVNYMNQLTITEAGLSFPIPEGNRLSGTTHETIDWQQIGGQLVLGVQLQLDPLWHLGTVLRFPSLRVYEDYQRVALATWAFEGQVADVSQEIEFDERAGLSTAMLLPMRFHLGVSRKLDTGRVALDVNYQAPFHDERAGLSWKPTFNVRVGAQHAVSEEFILGGGLFTDHSPTRYTESLGESDIDFYGLTAALNFGTAYEVRPVGAATSKTSLLTLGTTLALSYAVGFGRIARGEVALGGPNGARLDLVSESVVAHEITVHLSSSLGR